jgi:hypothetical protein
MLRRFFGGVVHFFFAAQHLTASYFISIIAVETIATKGDVSPFSINNLLLSAFLCGRFGGQ